MEFLNTSHIHQVLAATQSEQVHEAVGFSWTTEQVLTALMEQKVYGLIEDGQVVCFAIIEWAPDWMELHWIVSVHKRKGYGRKLLEYLEDLTISKGFLRICLEVSEKNKVAQGFYMNQGFIQDGVRPKYYNGQLDAILMSKTLN